MVKEVHFFTEMGYTAYSQDVAAKVDSLVKSHGEDIGSER
jgi:hypothetical protein